MEGGRDIVLVCKYCKRVFEIENAKEFIQHKKQDHWQEMVIRHPWMLTRHESPNSPTASSQCGLRSASTIANRSAADTSKVEGKESNANHANQNFNYAMQ